LDSKYEYISEVNKVKLRIGVGAGSNTSATASSLMAFAILMICTRSKDNSSFSLIVVLEEGTVFKGIEVCIDIRDVRRIGSIEEFELFARVVLRLSINYIASISLDKVRKHSEVEMRRTGRSGKSFTGFRSKGIGLVAN
jgi:hypothetical protein